MSAARCALRSLRATSGAALILCAFLCLLAPGGGAEIYKCKDAAGKTIYTSDPSACPGAKRHELKTEMQTVVPPSNARRPPAVVRGAPGQREAAVKGVGNGAAGDVPDGMAEMWRRKRPEAEAKLEQLKKGAAYFRAMVGGCNRGSTWYAKDEAGLKHRVSCDELRSRSEKIDREIAELEAYLASGLEEECRRAGCLPGWVR